MSVTIRNKTARSIPIVLDHPSFRTREWGFKIQPMTVMDLNKNGTMAQRIVRQAITGSVTIPANGVLEDMPDTLAACMQIRTLAARGILEIIGAKTEKVEPIVVSRRAMRKTVLDVDSNTPKGGE